MTYYHQDPYQPTSHQRAFPPASSPYAQVNAGPSTYQNQEPYRYVGQGQYRPSHVDNGHGPGYGHSANRPPAASQSKGTEYLRSLTSSVSRLNIADPRSHYASAQHAYDLGPSAYHSQASPSGGPSSTPLPPSDSRTRTYSDPRLSSTTYASECSPQCDKKLPPLPSHADLRGPRNSHTAYMTVYSDEQHQSKSESSHDRLQAPPLPPRPASLPLSTYDARIPLSETMRSALSSSFGAGPSRTPLTPLDASNTANSVEAGCSGEHTYRHEVQILPVEPESESERKSAAILQQASYPAKSFRPSVHPHSKPRLSDEARLRPPEPHTPPRPHSDPVVPVSEPTFKSNPQAKVKDRIRNRGRKGKEKATAGSPKRRQGRNGDDSEYRPIIDLTQLSSSESEQGVPSSDSSDDVSSQQVTSRSRIRHQRAVSEQPLRPTKSKSTPSLDRLSRMTITPDKTGLPNVNTGGTAVQCAGFTRTGQPCKRLVKTSAPYLVSHHGDSGSAMREEEGDQRSDRVMGRYCKDHAGMICQVGGFYWRGQQGNAGIWIDFADYIPTSLGQQTQALLRMTMESKLTDKECPGYLYAYELRDLETPTLTFFKVGRTDNVPRRIGQWTNQCQSKTPTLRDIFPLPTSASTSSAAAATLTATSSRTTPIKYTTTHHGKAPLMTAAQHPLHRSGTLTTSFLPGATTHLNPPSVAMKRWERLVHIELSDRCASDPESGRAFDRVREKCRDCGMGHKEIFPLRKASTRTTGTGAGAGANARAGTGVYEDVVVEIICRWERFILAIAA